MLFHDFQTTKMLFIAMTDKLSKRCKSFYSYKLSVWRISWGKGWSFWLTCLMVSAWIGQRNLSSHLSLPSTGAHFLKAEWETCKAEGGKNTRGKYIVNARTLDSIVVVGFQDASLYSLQVVIMAYSICAFNKWGIKYKRWECVWQLYKTWLHHIWSIIACNKVF